MQIVPNESDNYFTRTSASVKPDVSDVKLESSSNMTGIFEKKSRRCARTGNIAWGVTLTAFIPTLLSFFHMISEHPATATIGAAIGTGIMLTSLYVMSSAEEKKREADWELQKIKDANKPPRRKSGLRSEPPRAA